MDDRAADDVLVGVRADEEVTVVRDVELVVVLPVAVPWEVREPCSARAAPRSAAARCDRLVRQALNSCWLGVPPVEG